MNIRLVRSLLLITLLLSIFVTFAVTRVADLNTLKVLAFAGWLFASLLTLDKLVDAHD